MNRTTLFGAAFVAAVMISSPGWGQTSGGGSGAAAGGGGADAGAAANAGDAAGDAGNATSDTPATGGADSPTADSPTADSPTADSATADSPTADSPTTADETTSSPGASQNDTTRTPTNNETDTSIDARSNQPNAGQDSTNRARSRTQANPNDNQSNPNGNTRSRTQLDRDDRSLDRDTRSRTQLDRDDNRTQLDRDTRSRTQLDRDDNRSQLDRDDNRSQLDRDDRNLDSDTRSRQSDEQDSNRFDNVRDRFDDARDNVRDRFEDARDRFENDRPDRRADRDRDVGGSADADLKVSLEDRNGDLTVSSMQSNSILAEAGIQRGDVIVSLDGNQVRSQSELQRMIRSARGDRLPIIVERNGQRRTMHISTESFARGFDRGGSAIDFNGIEFAMRGDNLLIGSVDPGSRWRRWGLTQGDMIVSVDSRPIRSQAEFQRYIGTVDRYGRLPVVVLRDGVRETIYISTGEAYADSPYDHQYEDFRAEQGGWLGVYLDPRYERHAVVESVQAGSAADRAGIRAGDWVRALNGQQVRNAAHLSQLVGNMDSGEEIDLEVSRHESRRLAATLGSRPESYTRFQYESRQDNARGQDTRYRDDDRNDVRRYDDQSDDSGRVDDRDRRFNENRLNNRFEDRMDNDQFNDREGELRINTRDSRIDAEGNRRILGGDGVFNRN